MSAVAAVTFEPDAMLTGYGIEFGTTGGPGLLSLIRSSPSAHPCTSHRQGKGDSADSSRCSCCHERLMLPAYIIGAAAVFVRKRLSAKDNGRQACAHPAAQVASRVPRM